MCKPGHYSKLGEADCKPCPAGSYCVGGVEAATDPKPCPDGYYSSDGQIKCTKCPSGYICKQTLKTTAGIMKCPPGYIAKNGVTCEICPKGFMCPFPEFESIGCGPGTYAPQEGMSFCAPCPHGHSCSDPKAEAVACPNGKYAYLYDAQCESCPAHHACTGYLKIDCPLNFFSASPFSTCTPCTNGRTCMMNSPQLCKDGEYAIANSFICRKCPAGHSCKAGLATPCNSGFYAPYEGLIDCRNCPEGTFSLRGSTTCENCPGGHQCPGGGQPVACLPGQYSVLGDRSCKTEPGFVFPPYAERERPAVYFAPKGMYAELKAGQIAVLSCPAGTYSAVQGASDSKVCINCPEGFYCPEGTGNPIFYMCPQGHYCGAKSELPTPCPADTYSTTRGGRNIESCRSCPLG